MLPRLAIFGGFDNIVSINLKNWLFDVFCGLCIFAHLRLQTSFFWLWKMAGFCMIYLSRICRFMAIKPPKYFSCRIFFCHFAKLSTPKTQLCQDRSQMLLKLNSTKAPILNSTKVPKTSGIFWVFWNFQKYLFLQSLKVH